jgi:hypothetical protein
VPRGRARGIGFGAVERHDLVHLGEVAEIGEEDGEFHRLRERRTSRLCHRLQVLEHPPHLRLEVSAHQLHRGGVERHLAGKVDGVASAHGL